MVGDSREADVFAIPDFWPKSKRLEPHEAAHTPLFRYDALKESSQLRGNASPGLSLKASFSELSFNHTLNNKEIILDDDGFFRLPPLTSDEPQAPIPEASPEPADNVNDPGHVEPEDDLWMDAFEIPPKKACFRSWDAFDAGEVAPHEPMFLSEAGPNAYDALLSLPDDPLQLENSGVPIVAAEPYFSSLLALALGRDSIFFI